MPSHSQTLEFSLVSEHSPTITSSHKQWGLLIGGLRWRVAAAGQRQGFYWLPTHKSESTVCTGRQSFKGSFKEGHHEQMLGNVREPQNKRQDHEKRAFWEKIPQFSGINKCQKKRFLWDLTISYSFPLMFIRPSVLTFWYLVPSCGHIPPLFPVTQESKVRSKNIVFVTRTLVLFKSRKALTHTHTNALSKVKICQGESFPSRLEWIRPNLHTFRCKEKNSIKANKSQAKCGSS